MACSEWTYAYHTREPLPGEVCDCGQPATIVFTWWDLRDRPWCGVADQSVCGLSRASLPCPDIAW